MVLGDSGAVTGGVSVDGGGGGGGGPISGCHACIPLIRRSVAEIRPAAVLPAGRLELRVLRRMVCLEDSVGGHGTGDIELIEPRRLGVETRAPLCSDVVGGSVTAAAPSMAARVA